MKIRSANETQATLLRDAIEHLKRARGCLKLANCPKTLQRVRLALTSAGGAERHLSHRLSRTDSNGNPTKFGGEPYPDRKCSTPKCENSATLQLLGRHPICRACGDDKNQKARARSARARAAGQYSPSIVARMSPQKRAALHL